MRMMFIMGLVACGLAACQTMPPPNFGAEISMENDMVVSCGAENAQGLIGQPKSVLNTMRFSQTIRVVSPGMAVTQDFVPSRMNILLDENGVIAELRCG